MHNYYYTDFFNKYPQLYTYDVKYKYKIIPH